MVIKNNKKFNPKELILAAYSLVLVLLIHFFAPDYLYVQFFKYVALLGFILNVCSAFNVKVPYISDKKKLPKNYNFYAGIITFVIFLSYLIFFNK